MMRASEVMRQVNAQVNARDARYMGDTRKLLRWCREFHVPVRQDAPGRPWMVDETAVEAVVTLGGQLEV